jgi:proteasomal ATPase-associated factor 1
VLCSAAIGRGRQVITGSADGTSRIYDVSTGKQIGMLGAERFSSVNAMALAPTSSAAAQNGAAEESLHGLLVTGLSSGQVELHDLRSKQRTALLPTFLFPLGAAPAATDSWTQDRAGGIASVAWATEHMLFSGSLNGIVAAHDLRMASESNSNDASAAPASLLCSWRRNGAAVTDLFVPPTSGAPRELLVASADGLPYRADVEALLSGDGSAPRVTTELCGWEAESVEAVRLDGKGRVLGAGAEGMLRRY